MSTKMNAKKRHGFSFYGGDVLNQMAASWFVSYIFHKRIDERHDNWNRIGTLATRIKAYEKSLSYHRYWLDKIVSMDERRLNTNTIGLTAIEVKTMALKVLAAEW